MRGMKILAVTPWFPSDASPGTGLFNLRDIELISQDHDVTVLHLYEPSLTPAPHPVIVGEGAQVIPISFSTGAPAKMFSTVKRIRQLAKQHDIVHTMAFPALLPGWLSRLFTFGNRALWVHTEHWSALLTKAPNLRSTVGRTVLQPLLRAPDEIIAVSRELATVVDGYRARKQPAEVISNFVRFAPAGQLPEAPPGDSTAQLRLVAVGGLIQRKGVLETIHAVALLRERGLNAHLTWIGVGELEMQARALAVELTIAEQVKLVGHVDPLHLTDHLLHSHIFVLPTDAETFGVSIAEALAVGLPVVSSGVGGHLDFLPHEASRVVAKDPGSLAEAVIDLVNDPNRWSPAQIVADASRKFSEETRRSQYATVYERVHARARHRL